MSWGKDLWVSVIIIRCRPLCEKLSMDTVWETTRTFMQTSYDSELNKHLFYVHILVTEHAGRVREACAQVS